MSHEFLYILPRRKQSLRTPKTLSAYGCTTS